MFELLVDADRVGQRLDNALLFWLKGLPRSLLYRWVRKGLVRVNGKKEGVGYRLMLGDTVRVPDYIPPAEDLIQLPDASHAQWVKERILFEDDHCIVLNKPAGIPVQKGSRDRYSLIDYCVAAGLGDQFFLVHRLDKPTTGCFVLAKTRKAAQALGEQFKQHKVVKRYWAILYGACSWSEYTATWSLTKRESSQKRWVVVDPKGKEANSHFKVLSCAPEATFVEVSIQTGRTHQIRVHAQALGHPVWSDERYATEIQRRQMKQVIPSSSLFLHAKYLQFILPSSDKLVKVTSDVSEEFKRCLMHLSLSAP